MALSDSEVAAITKLIKDGLKEAGRMVLPDDIGVIGILNEREHWDMDDEQLGDLFEKIGPMQLTFNVTLNVEPGANNDSERAYFELTLINEK